MASNGKVMLREPLVPRLMRKYRASFLRNIGSLWPRNYAPSSRKITIIVPLAKKDIEIARICIPALLKNINHPIQELLIVGQDCPEVVTLSDELGVRYLNENTILPESIQNFKFFINGHNRNGWIRQQVIKLSAHEYCKTDDVLVCDADTVYLRPISFFVGDKQVLYTSDEYVASYHEANKYLLGDVVRYKRSFIAHGMLFQRKYMDELKAHIERHTGKPWQDALIAGVQHDVEEGVSEYELYGNYLWNTNKEAFIDRYWYNKRIGSKNISSVAENIKIYKAFNSISIHIRAGNG